MQTHEPNGACHAAADRSHPEVVIIASEASADVSRLMSQLAVRGRRVEVVKDEVAAVRRTLGQAVELLIFVQPTSDAARHQLAEAMHDHRPNLTLVSWDAATQQLHPIGGSTVQLAPSQAPMPTSDPAINDQFLGGIADNTALDSPHATEFQGWGDDDFAAEPLTAAELDALLGHVEPTGR